MSYRYRFTTSTRPNRLTPGPPLEPIAPATAPALTPICHDVGSAGLKELILLSLPNASGSACDPTCMWPQDCQYNV